MGMSRRWRRAARIMIAALAVALMAACSGSDTTAGPGTTGPGGGQPGGNAPEHNTATGELRTTGAINGVWHWQPGLAVCSSPTSVTLALDGQPSTVASINIGADGTSGFATSHLPNGGVNGPGGTFEIGDDGLYILKLDSVTMTDGQTTLVVDGEIRQRC